MIGAEVDTDIGLVQHPGYPLAPIPLLHKVISRDIFQRHTINDAHSFPGISAGRRPSPPAKSVPLPTMEAIENSTWRKTSQSTRKTTTTTMQSTAPRMIASSASSPSARRTGRGTHLRPDSDGADPSAFIGRNMRVYLDGEEESGSGSDVEIVSRDGVASKTRTLVSICPVICSECCSPEHELTSTLFCRSGTSSRVVTQIGKKSKSKQQSKATMDDDRLDITTTGESSDETASVISLTDSDAGAPSSNSTDSDPVAAKILPIPRPASPSLELVAALEHITLSLLRMQETQQLPFLKRNLRRGFKVRCSQVNDIIPKQDRGPGRPGLQLVYRLKKDQRDSEAYEYKSYQNSWSCPLCNLHGDMGSMPLLRMHLLWDHKEVPSEWLRDNEVCEMHRHAIYS